MGNYMFVNVMKYSQRYFNETIKAADVVLVVNRRKNTTRTETHFVDLPSGYTRPPVNSVGSAIFTVTTDYQNNGTTIVTFPTEYTYYDSSYLFKGTLATTATDGDSICRTAPNGTTVTLKSHPQPGPTTFPPDISSYVGNTDISIPFPPGGDTKGVFYSTYYDQINETKFYQSVFPGEAAFKDCSWPQLPAPATVMNTAFLLTDTSTSYEDDDATPAPGRKTSQDEDATSDQSFTPHFAHTEQTVPTTDISPTSSVKAQGDQSQGGGIGLAGAIASAASAAQAAKISQPRPTAAHANQGQNNNGGGNAPSQNSPGEPGQAQNTPNNPSQTQNTPKGPAQPTPASARTIVQNGVTVSADSSGNLVAGGQTLKPGSIVFVAPSAGASPVPVVIQTNGGSGASGSGGSGSGGGPGSGSSGSNGGGGPGGGNVQGNSGGSGGGHVELVVGGSTTTLSPGAFGDSATSPAGAALVPQPIVIGGTTFTPTATAPGRGSTAFVIDGQTLAPARSITIGSGSDTTVVALSMNAAGSSVLVVGGSTSILPTPTPGSSEGSSTIDIAGYIMSALGGPEASPVEDSGSITAAVLTIPAVGTRAAETVTAVEVRHEVFVIPGLDGEPARTITAGGDDVTINGVEVSAVATGIVIEEAGSETTVGVSTDALKTDSVGPTMTTDFAQFEGVASLLMRRLSLCEVLIWSLAFAIAGSL